MERYKRLALVVAAVEELNEHGSRTSRAHLHKALYFYQRWFAASRVYAFIIYQFGPYAFELDKDISELLSFSALISHPARDGYGAQYLTGESAKMLVTDYQADIEQWCPGLEFVATNLGHRSSRDLQLLGTTAFIQDEQGQPDLKALIAEVLRLKPQYDEREVEKAIVEVQALDAEARKLCAAHTRSGGVS